VVPILLSDHVSVVHVRSRRALDAVKAIDDERIEMLERMVREASEAAVEWEQKYEEVCIVNTDFL
jgi:hypothetical protein